MKAAEALVIVVATLAATCAAKVTPVKVKGNGTNLQSNAILSLLARADRSI